MMENLLVCLNAVLPIFIVMLLGYAARRLGAVRRESVPEMNRMAFRFFMPLMLFYNLYTSDLSAAVKPPLIAFAVCAVLCCYALALGFTMLTEKDKSRRSVMIQGIYRSNYVIIGLPIARMLVGGQDLGAVAVLVAIIVPIFNILAVITLESFTGEKVKKGEIFLDILKNPLILASAAGILALLTGLKLPSFVETVLSDMAAATSPLLLFLLGAFFKFDGIKRYACELIKVCFARLIAVPAIFLGLAALLGFRGVDFVALIGIFASSTAIASFTMAQQMGGDAELAGDIVVATSALCPVTIFGWSLLFKTLGIF